MPKIIENVHGLLVDEAKRQIREEGYDSVTIRSIARECGIGLGTFYNYFKSKDMLIASFLLDDWKARIDKVKNENEGQSDPMVVVRSIHNELKEFIESNISIFTSASAIKSFNSTAGNYHKMLRAQIAEPIFAACVKGGYEDAEFLSEFVAEAILTWTVAKKDYSQIESVIAKLFAQ